MAFNDVPTVSTGDLWTAANQNTYVRDNFRAGVPYIFTTKGDLAVASAATAAGRLGVGTDGQVLVADSAQSLGVKWQAGFVSTGYLGNASYDGDSISVGSTTIAANTFNASIPTSAKALVVEFLAYNALVTGGIVKVKHPDSFHGIAAQIRSTTGSYYAAGVIPLDASGQFEIIVTNQAVNLSMEVSGYFQ